MGWMPLIVYLCMGVLDYHPFVCTQRAHFHRYMCTRGCVHVYKPTHTHMYTGMRALGKQQPTPRRDSVYRANVSMTT